MASTDRKPIRQTVPRKATRPQRRPGPYIGSNEVAALGPLDPEAVPHGPMDPRWKDSFDRLGRYLTEVQSVRQRSTDPDARAARLMAAQLVRMADEFEAFESETLLLPPEERPGDRRVMEDHRRLVRALVRAFHRIEHQEKIALFELITEIERAANVRLRREEPRPREVWNKYAASVLEQLIKEFRASYPNESRRVTPAMIRAALDAAHQPRKGAPKWAAYVPIAKVLIGETTPNALRIEFARLRRRQPM